MKALTLTQPWASLVALGHKQIETRSWATRYRGPLAIHAAKGFPARARQFAEEERAIGRLPARIARGAVLCIVELIDCQPAELMALLKRADRFGRGVRGLALSFPKREPEAPQRETRRAGRDGQ